MRILTKIAQQKHAKAEIVNDCSVLSIRTQVKRNESTKKVLFRTKLRRNIANRNPNSNFIKNALSFFVNFPE